MRRLAAAVAVIWTALALPAAQAKGPQPVLGIAWDGPIAGRLAWFDPATLDPLRGRKVSLDRHVGAWAFSSDRSTLAIAASENASVRFVNARAMRRVGDLALRGFGGGDYVVGLAWARADRLLVAVEHGDGGGVVVVVDPQRRRALSRVTLPPIHAVRAVPGGMALLLGSMSGFEPARLAVLNADGAAREVVLDRIQIGHSDTQTGNDVRIQTAEPGIAVDAAGRRAFVVGADFTVAAVDLDALSVSYHAPSTRSLAKNVSGPMRAAAWVGNGTLAVGGADFDGSEDAKPAGLWLVDTRQWRFSLVDATAGWFDVGTAALVAGDRVFGLDGTPMYEIQHASDEWLSVQGGYVYVCDNGVGQLRRVLSLANGSVLRRTAGTSAPGCPTLLYGQSAG